MNFKIILPILLCTILLSCKTNSPSSIQSGLFKVTILYPNGDGKTFDMNYYQQKHMPMVAGLLGKNLKSYEIDKGISGRTPGDKLPFLAIGYFYIHSVEEYNKVVSQHRDAIVADFKNYTNIQPVIQISEVVYK